MRLLGSSGQPLDDVLRYAGAPGVVGGEGDAAAAATAAASGDAGSRDGEVALAGLGAAVESAAAAAAGEGDVDMEPPPPRLGLAAGGAPAGPPASDSHDGGDVLRALSPLDALHNCLLWRHVAPTAPDTLGCYPFFDSDPFALDDAHLPHLLFAGCQRAFGTRLVGDATGSTRVRLVCVPHFATTGVAVLVNLRSATLDAQPVCFAVGRGAAEAPPAFLV